MFLSQAELKQIEEAITQAESSNSGEIRVHIAAELKQNIFDEALQKIADLGIDQTPQRNAILILICPAFREFAIVGDQDVHEKVSQAFWNQACSLLAEHFSQGAFAKGIIKTVGLIGEKLTHFYPTNQRLSNSLPNHVSFD